MKIMNRLNSKSGIYYRVYSALLTGIDFLAPRHCEVCSQYIENGNRRFEFICDKCTVNFPLAPPSEVIINSVISNFKDRELVISQAFCLFSVADDFDYIELIHSLKYRGFTRIGTEFGKELGFIINKNSGIKYDGIVPVPIHHARRRERGFNQSDIIADAISSVNNIPVKRNLIRRSHYTQSQTQLTASERHDNIKDVIIPFRNDLNLNGKNYLVVDDVLTTGATINACAKALISAGAERVDCAALAFA
jgi:ComF family protein